MWTACTPFVIQGAMPIMSPFNFLENEGNRERMVFTTRYTDNNELELQEITLEDYFERWKLPASKDSLQIRVSP